MTAASDLVDEIGPDHEIAGDVESSDDLIARTRAEHRANGIDLRLGVTATGAEPRRPDVPGAHAECITAIPQGE